MLCGANVVFVSRRSRPFALLLAITALALVSGSGCGGPKPESQEAAAPAPKPKNAIAIARSIVNARVGAMIWAERFHGHALESRLQALNPIRSDLQAAGIDPTRDLVAAYVASTGVTTNDLV